MRSTTASGLIGLACLIWAACEGSPVDPYADLAAETVGTEFVSGAGVTAIPVSISNVSNGTLYHVWTAPGGLCASLDRHDGAGWIEESNGGCHPNVAAELGPGERLVSEVVIPADAGTYRLRIHVSEQALTEAEEYKRTNAFTIRPE